MRKNKESRSEERLTHLSQKLRELFDDIDCPIYVSDPQTYEILFANRKLGEIAGEEILGKRCYKVLRNFSKPCPFCTNKYIFGENLGKTLTCIRKNTRDKRWYKYIEKAIKWPEDKHVRFTLAIDITRHKQTEESLLETNRRLHALIQAIPDVIHFKDIQGRNLIVNKAFEKLVGLKQEEIVGKTDEQLFPRDLAEQYQKSDEEVLGKKEIRSFEEQAVGKDGERIFFETVKAPFFNAQGDVIGLVGVSRNITDDKRAEEVLREKEELFRSVVENSHDGILILDDNFRIIYSNDEAARIGGNPREEIVGQDFRKYLGRENKSCVERRYLRRQNGEKTPSTYEMKIDRKDGKKRDIKVRSSTVRDNQGRVRTIAQVLDVTELKKMRKERKHFEERLSALNKYGQSLNMARSSQEIYDVTLEAMEKTLGFEYASFMIVEGKALHPAKYCGYPKKLDLRLPLDGERGITVKAARTGKSVYVTDIRKNKEYVSGGVRGMLSELAVPVKVANEVYGVLNVESRRIAAFDEDDEKLVEILASHTAIAVSNLNRQAKLRELSKKTKHLMRSTTKIMHIDDMHERLEVITEAIEKFGWGRVVISLRDENLEGTDLVTTGLTRQEIKLLIQRKAPGHIWRERLGPKFERFKIGGFYYLPWNDQWIREIVHGISPRAELEEATTYAGVPSKVLPEEMVDWHPQDMLYAPLRTPDGRIVGILSMDDPLDGRKPTRESLAPLELFLHQAAIIIENAQLIKSLQKARRQLETYADQLEEKVEERTCELKKSQEQLLKAQRLAVIGELAGMVGHDLRNPLTSINGAAYYLNKRLHPKRSEKIKRMLDLIQRNIAYSNKIINDLLDYSKEVKLDSSVSSPKSIVMEALSIVEIPDNVRIVDSTRKKPKAEMDPAKMKRAFVNIINNAIDAMPKGGTLTIRSKKLNDKIEFAFSDTGVGMSEHTLKKLWTPLYTTKAKGMGFGLPICRRIIEAHEGSISVDSSLGKGTTFTVTIPIKPKHGGEKIWVETLESSSLMTTRI